MEPGIGRSLGKGFGAANRSWLGIAFFAGVWFLVVLFTMGGVLLTRIPEELFRQPALVETPATPTSAQPSTAAPATAATPAQGANLFTQLATTAGSEPQAPEAAQPASTANPTDEQKERSYGVALDWLGRAWPMLVVCLLALIAANLWLTGGQIGYLVKRVASGQVGVSEFWVSGGRVFPTLLGGWLISVGAVTVLALAVALIAVVFSGIARVVPDWLLVIVGLLLALALIVALVWLSVRLVFWFIAIVRDAAGPIASLKASFHTTRGRWWRIFGLQLVLGLFGIGIFVVLQIVEGLGGLAGGGVLTTLKIVSGLAGAVANLYLGFLGTAANIQFYEDLKSLGSKSTPAASH